MNFHFLNFHFQSENFFLIVFLFLAIVIFWVCWDIIKLIKKEKETPSQKTIPQNELFLTISEEFKVALKELIKKELQKNLREFEEILKKTSEEIIKDYHKQFSKGEGEVENLLKRFSQEIEKEISNLARFNIEIQKKITNEMKNEIVKLNHSLEKEITKIQEINLKTSTQTWNSIKENLNQKIKEAEKEIENYKKERLAEIERNIYQLLGKVAKNTLGKAIDLSTHEKLVMEALEKAKKEIF